jgi:predicted Fe-S protein YdhL (DUF1289 family)
MTSSSDPMANALDGVPSPCVRNCCLDENNICMGCARSISEICGWSEASDAEKREILARSRIRFEQRRGKLKVQQ